VFAVYLNPNLRVYECRAEYAEDDDPLCPIDWPNRYRGVMERHFLAHLVDGKPEFAPEPWYNPCGDSIVYQLADEAIVADRIDEMLTIFRSAVDDRPIGFQIKGVTALIRKSGLYGLTVSTVSNKSEVDCVSITALLPAAYEEGPRTLNRRRGYAQAVQSKPPNDMIARELLVPA